MALSDAKIRSAKAGDKSRKLSDGRGLYLLVTTKGHRWWRFDYRFHGRRKTLSMGVYPDVSLAQARARREEARRLLADGVDPALERRERKTESNSFASIAQDWFEAKRSGWVPSHGDRVWRRLEKHALPWLGDRPAADLRAPEVLEVLRRVEARGNRDTAHRLLQTIRMVFRHGIVLGRLELDPCTGLQQALQPYQTKHFAAITEPQQVGQLLRSIDAYFGSIVVRCGLQLAPLVFVRPGELRQARWEDFDFLASEWRFVASKTGQEHIVPLATQALDILKEVRAISGSGEFVFPASRGRNRPISDATLGAAVKSLGYDGSRMTVHGFRAMARTLLDEQLEFPPHLIEHQLAHRVKDPLGRAYNRTKHLPKRHEMMQRWADYLEGLRDG